MAGHDNLSRGTGDMKRGANRATAEGEGGGEKKTKFSKTK